MARDYSSALLVAMLLISAAALPAQIRPELGLGVVVPTGDLGTYRRPGPVITAGVIIGSPARRTRLRIGLEGASMAGESGTPPLGTGSAGLRLLSGAAELLLGPRGTGLAPYAVAGATIHRMSAKGVANPYGAVAGLQAGVGLRKVVREGREVRGEVTPHLILSDYATGQDFSAGSYVSMTMRVTF